MRQRVWRAASKEEGLQGRGCAAKFSGLGLFFEGVRRGPPPGLGAWTDGDGRTGGRDAVSCFSLHSTYQVGGLQKERSLQVRKRVRRLQRVCQATQISTGGRHSSYRPALVFPRPRRRSASPLEIWHPAILWCVPPSFGGERAGMVPSMAGALAGLGFRPRALGSCPALRGALGVLEQDRMGLGRPSRPPSGTIATGDGDGNGDDDGL